MPRRAKSSSIKNLPPSRSHKKEDILLNVLHKAQQEHGYLSEHVLKQISIEYDIPIARLWGVVKFYTKFRTEPVGRYVIEICTSPSCVLNNGLTVEEHLKQLIGARSGQTSKDGLFTIYRSSCIGCCDEAPAMLINGKPYTRLTVERVTNIINRLREEHANIKADKP